ncbi:type VI secretion system membrane subunit TssM [Vibrio sp. SCSIO 43137]|uniref:type VI secretion system membrane subunit TssM n=1 Tax=Vibrio sp. SCSIO 43137 TaxID=3021011 RepID=UPI0023081465|nr:type VI secretion system membrane subunit TssM [Vibrio sp. SCSIO 43137]WCE31033.1 type VI secretion system membrane subunit TssM [Vibrio sp. SCSIO 43137]
MIKKIIVTVIALLILLSGISVWWFEVFKQDLGWLNIASLIAGSIVFVAALIWLYRQRSKDRAARKAHEQEVLLKKDTQYIQDIFKKSVKRVQGSGSVKLKTLYDLPWYLLIGGEGDAKSSILQQNGLEPVLNNQTQKEDEEHYLKFWSNDRVVVLEVGHRLFDNEGIDEALWSVLCQQLIKYRPRQAINGVVSVIGCDRLLKGDRKDRQRLSSIIQEAILTLSDRIGIRVPVYATFSKSDTLTDFTEFFESFSGTTLDSPMGITFEDTPAGQFDSYLFDKQAKALVSSLADQQFELLKNSHSDKAGSVVAFPYQFTIFLQRCKQLLRDIGRENRVRESVWIRGSYFLSSGQKGASFDLLTQTMADRSEFNTAVVSEQDQNRRSYFVSGLFSKVILPESRLVGVNSRRQTSYFLLTAVAMLAMVSVLTLAGLELKNNWNQDEAWRAKTTTQLSVYASDIARLNRETVSITDIIAVLYELREVVVEGAVDRPWYEKVSIRQDETAQLVNRAYHDQLNEILLPRVEEIISNELYVYISLGNPSKIFEILRFYQMLFDEKRLDINDMQEYLLENLNDQGDVSEQDINKLSLLIDDLFSGPYDKTLTANEELIAVAVNNLEGLSAERLIYSRIKSLPAYNGQVDIRRQLGEKFSDIFLFEDGYHGFLIPEIYTRQGYSNLDLSAKSAILRLQMKEFKMMQGDFSAVSITEMTELSRQIQRLYFADYIYRWKDLIANIKVRDFATAQELSLALRLAREPATSPILDVLDAIVVNTTLAVEEQPDTRQQKQVAAQLGVKQLTNIAKKADKINRLAGDKLLRLQPSFVVNEAFKNYAAYIDSEAAATGGAPMNSLLAQFDQLNSYFDSALSSANPAKAFYGYATAHAQGSQDAIVMFSREAGKAPNQVAGWVKAIAGQSWASVINSSVEHINVEWQNRVYGFYSQAIAGRFPFSTDSRSEIELNDFAMFFKAQGTVEKFVDDVLSPFVEWENQKLVTREIDGRALPVKRDALAQLSKSKQLQKLFFNTSGQELALNFRVKPSSMSTDVTEFRMSEVELLFDYRHGPRVWSDINWPSNAEDSELRLSFFRGEDRVATQAYQGKWGLIRVVFDSKISATGDSRISKVRFEEEGKHIIFDSSIGDGSVKFSKPFFSGFSLPRKL